MKNGSTRKQQLEIMCETGVGGMPGNLNDIAPDLV